MSPSATRQHFIKSLAIVIVGGAFVGMVLLSVFFTSELARLANENERLVSERRVLDLRMNEIEGNFKKINSFSDALDELTLATVAGDVENIEQQEGRIDAIREALQTVRYYSSSDESQVNLVLRADEVVANTGRLAQTLRDLVSILEHRREILDATPTLTPTTGWISSFYGERHSPFSGKEVIHRGIDIGAEPGAAVFAPAEGVVDVVGNSSSFGNFLVIKHPYGIATKYAHNEAVLVKKGQRVKRGQVVAKVGSTGRSTGPHLHYEVWVGSKPVDPRNFLLDQKLKVINLAGVGAIGGEEFDVHKSVEKSNLPTPEKAEFQLQAEPQLTVTFDANIYKAITIAICLLLASFLGYFVALTTLERQRRPIFRFNQ